MYMYMYLSIGTFPYFRCFHPSSLNSEVQSDPGTTKRPLFKIHQVTTLTPTYWNK